MLEQSMSAKRRFFLYDLKKNCTNPKARAILKFQNPRLGIQHIRGASFNFWSLDLLHHYYSENTFFATLSWEYLYFRIDSSIRF